MVEQAPNFIGARFCHLFKNLFLYLQISKTFLYIENSEISKYLLTKFLCNSRIQEIRHDS